MCGELSALSDSEAMVTVKSLEDSVIVRFPRTSVLECVFLYVF
jgi:CRP-like cAMP-binding protein